MKNKKLRKAKGAKLLINDGNIKGDKSGIYGNAFGVHGDATGITGNLDDCGITDEDRKVGVNINNYVEEEKGSIVQSMKITLETLREVHDVLNPDAHITMDELKGKMKQITER